MHILYRTALAATLLATQAHAHATLEPGEAQTGKNFKGTLRINHGCEGSPTISVLVTVPEGLVSAKPMAKPGWKIETATGKYANQYTLYGQKIDSGVVRITWSGGNLPDSQFDEFVFTGSVAPGLATDQPLYFPVLQSCEKGERNWAQIPLAGHEGHALATPAPSIKLVAAVAPQTQTILGPLLIRQPWSRATPGAAPVAGGYISITNSGSSPDRLIGGSTDISAGLELHQMSNEDGIMKMRQLPAGVEIAPGATVDLKPGGLHIMFTGLKQQLKQGDSFKVKLMFEKAGEIVLDFPVSGLGAQAPVDPANAHSGH